MHEPLHAHSIADPAQTGRGPRSSAALYRRLAGTLARGFLNGNQAHLGLIANATRRLAGLGLGGDETAGAVIRAISEILKDGGPFTEEELSRRSNVDHKRLARLRRNGREMGALEPLVEEVLARATRTIPVPRVAGSTPRTAGGRDAASDLVALARADGVETFTYQGDPYVSLHVNGHVETHPLGLRSPALRDYLLRLYRSRHARLPGREAVAGAVEALAADARCGEVEHAVFLRVGALPDGRIAIDRGDASWTAIVVGAAGWEVVPHPVRFRRPRSLLSLPMPEGGGSIDELWAFLNLGSPSDRYLVMVWLVAALRPVGPYGVLLFHGEAGTAKSTATKICRSLVDPSTAPMRHLPKDIRDLFVAARANRCLAFDNVSAIPRETSDAICQIASGGGYATRELYSDNDEVVLTAQRPVIITSVEEVARSGDLLERSLLVELHPISPENRRTEKRLWRDFEQARPRLLGSLLDLVASTERELPGVEIAAPPRMADFAELGVAVERAKGWPDGAFLRALEGSALEAADTALGGYPIVPTLVKFASEVDRREPPAWVGSAAELLDELTSLSGKGPEDLRRLRDWPPNPGWLGRQLVRIGPDLRKVHGVDLQSVRRSRDAKRWRVARVKGGNLLALPALPAPSTSNAAVSGAGKGSPGAGKGSPVPATVPPSTGAPGSDRLATSAGSAGSVPAFAALAGTPDAHLSDLLPGAGAGSAGIFPSFGEKEEEGNGYQSLKLTASEAEEGVGAALVAAESIEDLNQIVIEFQETIVALPLGARRRVRAVYLAHRDRLVGRAAAGGPDVTP